MPCFLLPFPAGPGRPRGPPSPRVHWHALSLTCVTCVPVMLVSHEKEKINVPIPIRCRSAAAC
jgi:hypothetical protein